MESGKQNFARRLTELRKERKLSQNALALSLGYSRGQIGNYELGSREPDFSTLIKIAEFFNVSVDFLIGNTDARSAVESAVKSAQIKPSLEKLVSLAENLSDESIDYLTRDAKLLEIKEKQDMNRRENSSTLTGSC
jgi:transcriptional regulator with XRE-family HTH domain